MANDITFYNRSGQAIAWLSAIDNETIYSFDGKPLAYIYDNCVYSFKGVQLGWYEKGWIFDLEGYCVFCTKNAIGGPIKPVCGISPVKSIKKVKPIKGVRAIKRVKRLMNLSWVNDYQSFFK